MSDRFSIPVFFVPAMVADAASFSPSPRKPAEVVRDWQVHGFPIDVRTFAPVARNDLYRAHHMAYVNDVLDLQLQNGFGNKKPEVAHSLPYTSGAMLAAATEAIANGRVAVAPVSGFHHAGFDFGGGYCTFNGLMVTATALKAKGLATRVGILDLDQHWGNGTKDIIDRLDLSFVRHYSAGGAHWDTARSENFLDQLSRIVEGFKHCDVLLYQAGADPHIDDPLGGWLTTAQLRRRDEIVFSTARRLGLPIAWNLAGGYQQDERGGIEPVLRIHRNTMAACVRCFSTDGDLPELLDQTDEEEGMGFRIVGAPPYAQLRSR